MASWPGAKRGAASHLLLGFESHPKQIFGWFDQHYALTKKIGFIPKKSVKFQNVVNICKKLSNYLLINNWKGLWYRAGPISDISAKYRRYIPKFQTLGIGELEGFFVGFPVYL